MALQIKIYKGKPYSSYNDKLLGRNGTPPIFSLCFWVNLTANQRGDYERMRCRHRLNIQPLPRSLQ